MKRWVILSLALLAFLGCSRGKEKVPVPRGKARVHRGSIRLEVTATGAVKPQVGAEVRVGSRISGKVERLFVQAGDRVERGQLVAVIEHKDLEARMKAARRDMEGAEATLGKVKEVYPAKIEAQRAVVRRYRAEVSLARLEYKRIKALLREELVSQDDLDRAERDLKVKRAQLGEALNTLRSLEDEYRRELQKARADMGAARQRYKEARVRLKYAYIYAPIAGVVSSVTTQEGETVVAGLNAPTFITVVDLSRLQVDAYVDETDIGKIRPGQQVRFTVDAYPDKVFRGVVKTVYPGAIIRNNVVFYDTAIEIKTPYRGLLKPEMTADVTVIAGEKRGVLVVPSSAVKIGMDGKSYCFVQEKGKWVKREVKTGWESEGKVEILQGLREGEVVALW